MLNENLFKRIFSNPWIGFLGSLASFIGIGLAIFFYFLSIQTPNLTYFVNPIRTSIVKQTNTSGLSILYNNTPLNTDVSSLQIALWNAGRRPIERNDILSPIQISLGSNTKILEATTVHTSRDVTAFSIKNDSKLPGTIDVDWRILENGDGGVIQVIYAGKSSINPKISGTIIGQKSISTVNYSYSIPSPEEQLHRSSKFDLITGTIFILLSILYTAFKLLTWIQSSRDRPSKPRRKSRLLQIAMILFPIIYIIFGIYLITQAFTKPTPFDM